MQHKFNSRVALFSALLDGLTVGLSLWVLATVFGTHWSSSYSLAMVAACLLYTSDAADDLA